MQPAISTQTITIQSTQLCKTAPKAAVIEASDLGLSIFPQRVTVQSARGTFSTFKIHRPILVGQGEDIEVAGYEYRNPAGFTVLIQND